MRRPRGPADAFTTGVMRPPDCDAFWARTMSEAAATPLNPAMRRVPMRCTDEVDVYEIHYDSTDGLRIAGWYCVPTASYLEPPYPGLLRVPGYISDPTLPRSWARMGYATVGVAHRGKLGSDDAYRPGFPGLLVDNILDRDTYAYRGVYVDACRAVDFLLTRPEVDHSRIGVHGTSQGGGLTVAVAALRADVVTCGAAGAPFLASIMDCVSLTRSYPYEEINEYLRMYPGRAPQVRSTVAYVDGVSLAPMIRCPMFVYIGLADDVIPPESGYAVVDAMTCPVELLARARCGHDAGKFWAMARVESFLAEHLHPAPTGVHAEMTVG